jgi:hypothetical protein
MKRISREPNAFQKGAGRWGPCCARKERVLKWGLMLAGALAHTFDCPNLPPTPGHGTQRADSLWTVKAHSGFVPDCSLASLTYVVAAAGTMPKAPEQNEQPTASWASRLEQGALKVFKFLLLRREGGEFHLGQVQVGNTAG